MRFQESVCDSKRGSVTYERLHIKPEERLHESRILLCDNGSFCTLEEKLCDMMRG